MIQSIIDTSEEVEEAYELLRLAEEYEQGYFTFKPRHDDPARYDQQTAFVESKTRGIAWLIGGNGCLAGEQELLDPVDNTYRRVDSIQKPTHVFSRNELSGMAERSVACQPFVKGVDRLYEVILSDGQSFRCTMGHRVLTPQGWRALSELAVGDELISSDDSKDFGEISSQNFLHISRSCECSALEVPQSDRREGRLPSSTVRQERVSAFSPFASRFFAALRHEFAMKAPSLSSSLKHAWNYLETALGYSGDCSVCHYLYGEQLQLDVENDQAVSPLRDDAREHIQSMSHWDGLASESKRNHLCRSHVRHSNFRYESLQPRYFGDAARISSKPYLRSFGQDDILSQDGPASTASILQMTRQQKFRRASCPTRTTAASGREATGSFLPCDNPSGYCSVRIVQIRFLRVDKYYDLTVWPNHNYLAGGCWHHNSGTTEAACCKLARFLLSTPPPRQDTPFWVISDTYESCMESTWKEKLEGHGHIPRSEIDYDRIQWYRPNLNLPFRVPLKPWPGRPGKNWTLEFKSYEQGRAKLQARAIGGFCFVEQFPWGILTEVLRGCREYNFPGSKFCEFTPVDPNLSIELEEMIENGYAPKDRAPGVLYLPDDWEVYRANTECAKEAGHIDAKWFAEFFGMVPDEMRETRMTGRFATYEGQIYQTFNPLIHLVGDDECFPNGNFPLNVFHRRGLDWGGGPDNAFCALFAYRNGMGQYYIYDEYYSTDQTKTTVDHLCDIQDSWPWPVNNPHYGTTYADPSDPDNIRIAQKLGVYAPGRDSLNISGASNSVLEGIEHVRYMLKPQVDRDGRKEPKLFIHAKRCPNLARQMRTYRWLRATNNSINPKDARREPLKKDDHACFPSGSLVATPQGDITIECLSVGDKVFTHLGIGSVDVGPAITGWKELWAIALEGGDSILCTADHPIALSDGTWRPASQCKRKSVDVLCPLLRAKPVRETGFSSSSGKGIYGVDIPIPSITQFAGTIAGRNVAGVSRRQGCNTSGFISKCIENYMGKSRQAMSCITKMKTTTTIHSTTLRHKLLRNIPESITETFPKQSKPPRNGIDQPLAVAGTVNTRKPSPPSKRRFRSDARIADGLIGQKTVGHLQGSAISTARWRREKHLARMMNREFVRHARRGSLVTATQRRNAARVNVVASIVIDARPTGRFEPVYSIATSDGAFFVGNVLVSNCDSLRYLLFSEAQLAGVTPSSMRRNRDIDRNVYRGVYVPQRNGNGSH